MGDIIFMVPDYPGRWTVADRIIFDDEEYLLLKNKRAGECSFLITDDRLNVIISNPVSTLRDELTDFFRTIRFRRLLMDCCW